MSTSGGTSGGGGGAPTGPAGGDLGGTYPNPTVPALTEIETDITDLEAAVAGPSTIPESAITNLTTDLAAKQSTALTSAHVLVGNGSNVAADVALSGDATLANTGAMTLKNTGPGATGPLGTAARTNTVTIDAQGRVTAFTDQAIAIAESAVTNLTTDLAAKAPLASPALTGVPTAPTAAAFNGSTQLATTAYVDNATLALDIKPDVAYASTSALPANTYANGSSGVGATLTGNSNGPLIIDGVTLAVGQAGERVLVAAEAASANNGWYTITQVGVIAVSPYILTRATESDQAAEIGAGYLTGVVAPNTVVAGANNGKLYISVAADPFTVGTTALTFSQVGGTYAAGTGLSLSGSTFAIDTATTVDKTTAQTLTNKTLTSPVVNTPTGIVKADVGLGNVDNTSNATERAATATLTNKTLTTPIITSPTGLAIPQIAVVTADVTHTQSSTTLSNVTGLLAAIGASATEIWFFEAYLLISAVSTTVDYKFGWTVPTACTMQWGGLGTPSNNNVGWGLVSTSTTSLTLLPAGSTLAGGSNNGTIGTSLAGLIFGGGTAGNVQLQFAQNTSEASDLKVLKGSMLRYTQIVA